MCRELMQWPYLGINIGSKLVELQQVITQLDYLVRNEEHDLLEWEPERMKHTDFVIDVGTQCLEEGDGVFTQPDGMRMKRAAEQVVLTILMVMSDHQMMKRVDIP